LTQYGAEGNVSQAPGGFGMWSHFTVDPVLSVASGDLLPKPPGVLVPRPTGQIPSRWYATSTRFRCFS